MVEVDVDAELQVVENQISVYMGKLSELNAQREQVIQQINNLHGIAMYLRGKQESEESESDSISIEQLVAKE